MRELYERVRDWWERYENPIWRGSIHRIESQFGGAYASYFIFLRWLFLLNLGLSLFYVVLVVAIGIADTDWSTVATDFIPYLPSWVRRRTPAGRAPRWACTQGTVRREDGRGGAAPQRGTETSFFFMGGYSPLMLDGAYHMDVAYFATVIITFLISFIAVVEAYVPWARSTT